MNFQELNLKEICEGLPDWAHWFVWVGVIAFHFWSRAQLKNKIFKQIFGDEVSQPEETIMQPKEIGHTGVTVAYTEGTLVISALDGNAELKIKAAAAINPALDKIAEKVKSGEIDLIKGTTLDNDAMLKAIELLKAEFNK